MVNNFGVQLLECIFIWLQLYLYCKCQICIFRAPTDSSLYLVREHDPEALSKSFDHLKLFEEQKPDIFSVSFTFSAQPKLLILAKTYSSLYIYLINCSLQNI